ncbi:citrate lyase holo-[acyl-carrier protein] synthase [Halomonas sp. BM-2019]|uniref:citrate lyase holo-[acyl-carrier protein] synthase n=1 Tax=Halomonas sp. BM-2019 TaxID=2811227 RepID=UPI001B3C29C0|nr:MAG: citrate lyase holo-[acyl-carrier protein] synthase [Halomonas sp. BM-2019]
MSYAKLQAELLAARDAREALLVTLLAEGPGTLIFASTAIPGPDKSPPGSLALFEQGLERLERRLGASRQLAGGHDRLGPYRVLASPAEPRRVKHLCLAIETREPAARLLDLDVYDGSGARIGRADLGLAPRRCLLCEQPASDCIRLRRHAMTAILAHVHSLLHALDHRLPG